MFPDKLLRRNPQYHIDLQAAHRALPAADCPNVGRGRINSHFQQVVLPAATAGDRAGFAERAREQAGHWRKMTDAREPHATAIADFMDGLAAGVEDDARRRDTRRRELVSVPRPQLLRNRPRRCAAGGAREIR